MANPEGLTKASEINILYKKTLVKKFFIFFQFLFISKIKEMIEKIIPG